MQEDPNYNEVAIVEVDLNTLIDSNAKAEKSKLAKKPLSLIKRIINWILLAIKKIYARLVGRKEKVYKPEPVGLKYIHIEDLTKENLKDLGAKSVKKDCVLFSSNEEDPDPIELHTFHSHTDALNSIIGGKSVQGEVPAVYPIRDRVTGRVMMVRGTVESLKKQYSGKDYEIVEPYIKG